MSIVRKVGIDGREVLFKASAAIPRIYRLKFQRDIYKDLRILEKSIGEGDEERSNLDLFSLEMFENIAYTMAKHADPAIPDDVEEWLTNQGIREEDEISVCELFDQYERKGREEGIETGRKEGLIEGKKAGIATGIKCGEARRLVTDIENVMRFFQVTLEKACEGLGTTVGRYEEAKKLL